MWKKYQAEKRVRSKIKLALATLLGLLLLLFLAKSFNLLLSFNQPFDKNLGDNQKFHWDQRSAINLVFVSNLNKGEQIALVNFQPKTDKFTILNLSDQIYLELPKNYGFWRLGAIYQLGQEEGKNGQGASLLKYSVAKLTGLPIDGIIFMNTSQAKEANAEELFKSLHKNPLNLMR